MLAYSVWLHAALLPCLARAFPMSGRGTTPGALYDSSGKPNYEDVRQTTIPDCGFASASAAVAHANPAWIASQITFSGNFDQATEATFSVHSNTTLEVHPQLVRRTDLPGNADDKRAVWWSGGIEHAAKQMGFVLEGIGPEIALEIITGRRTTWKGTHHEYPSLPQPLSADDIWDLSGHASSSPVCLTTIAGTKTLVGGHASAMLGRKENEGGAQLLTLYNPWGSSTDYDLGKIFEDTADMRYLEGFPTGPDAAPAGPAATTSPARPASTSESAGSDESKALGSPEDEQHPGVATKTAGYLVEVEVMVYKTVYAG